MCAHSREQTWRSRRIGLVAEAMVVMSWVLFLMMLGVPPSRAFVVPPLSSSSSSSSPPLRGDGVIVRRMDLPTLTEPESKVDANENVNVNVNMDVGNGNEQMVVDTEILSQLGSCTTGTAARRVLEEALFPSSSSSHQGSSSSTRTPLFDSLRVPPGASTKKLRDADLAIQTGFREGPGVMDRIEMDGTTEARRSSYALVALVPLSFVAAVQVDDAMTKLLAPWAASSPSAYSFVETLRFVVVWVLSFAPLLFVGAGLAAPRALKEILEDTEAAWSPSARRRTVRHEAGHFLMGHLLGMPVRDYRLRQGRQRRNPRNDGAPDYGDAVEFFPLADPDVGRERRRWLGFDDDTRATPTSTSTSTSTSEPSVESYEGPYFSERGRGSRLVERSVLPAVPNGTGGGHDDDDDEATRRRKRRTGGLSPENDPTTVWPFRRLDDQTLDTLGAVSMAGACAELLEYGDSLGAVADLRQFRSFCTEDDNDTYEARVRFAIGYGVAQLRRHRGVLDDLMEIMDRGGSVEDCVVAIETCQDVTGVVERVDVESANKNVLDSFLSLVSTRPGKAHNDVYEGRGGGDRKPTLDLTGDDPFYLAAATAFAFLLWASSGGLTLH